MNKTWSNKIDEVLSIGTPLHAFGVNNWALSRDQALDALDSLEELGVVVLGGDVYLETNKGIRSNRDNWHYDSDVNESHSRTIHQSIEKAREYIARYRTPAALFVLVPHAED